MEAWRPGTAGEVAETVRAALARRTALEIVGRGTKRGLGGPVAAADLLSLAGLDRMIAYEPEEMVVTAEPGLALAEIERQLATRRQMLAFEPPDWGPLWGAPAGEASLGGVLGCNASGPRRIKAGAARDHFLGLEAVSGRGETFKAGGRVVKNVTGYDLPKLLCGSYGTLAVLTEVTLRVVPAPETVRTLLLIGLDDVAAIRALAAAARSAYEPTALAHLPAAVAARLAPVSGAGRSVTALRLEGPAPSVAHRLGALRDLLGGESATLDETASRDLWRLVGNAAPFAAPDACVLWRVSVPPLAGPALAAASGAAAWFYDWAGGLIWLAYDKPEADGGAARLRAALAACGGHATLFRAPEEMRRRVAVFEPEPAPLAALSERVRASFDPLGILNPGRMRPPKAAA